MTVCAILPAYNVARYLPSLLEELSNFVDHAVVVNDGSTDNTQEVLSELGGEFACLTFFRHPRRLGKAEAIRTGIAKWKDVPHEVIVCMDADCAHSPRDIPSLVSRATQSDVVVGNRYSGKSLDSHRHAVVTLARLAVESLTGYSLGDPMCGFRAFNARIARVFAENLSGRGYSVEIEELLIARHVQATVSESALSYTIPQDFETKACEFQDIVEMLLLVRKSLTKSEEAQLTRSLSRLRRKESFNFTYARHDAKHRFHFKYVPEKDSYSLSYAPL